MPQLYAAYKTISFIIYKDWVLCCQTPVLFFQVSENGVISFDAEWKFAHPSRFPTDYFYTRNAYVVAPFWSDNDIRKEGTVRYVAIEEGESARGDEMLRVASDFVLVNFTVVGKISLIMLAVLCVYCVNMLPSSATSQTKCTCYRSLQYNSVEVQSTKLLMCA